MGRAFKEDALESIFPQKSKARVSFGCDKGDIQVVPGALPATGCGHLALPQPNDVLAIAEKGN